MLRKESKIKHPGDTGFLKGEQIERELFVEENERVLAKGGVEATGE